MLSRHTVKKVSIIKGLRNTELKLTGLFVELPKNFKLANESLQKQNYPNLRVTKLIPTLYCSLPEPVNFSFSENTTEKMLIKQ